MAATGIAAAVVAAATLPLAEQAPAGGPDPLVARAALAAASPTGGADLAARALPALLAPDGRALPVHPVTTERAVRRVHKACEHHGAAGGVRPS